MRHLVLDTSHCSTADELHDALKQQLALPDYYGRNLDALWDCITGEVALPLVIEWRGYVEARQAIGSYVEKVLEVLLQAQHEVDGLMVKRA